MGLLVDGQWQDQWYDTKSTGGRYKRQEQAFRSWITADGSAGPSGTGGFAAEKNRYHLYVSFACPWAHRTLIFRELKGLQEHLPVSVVHWLMGDHGWSFAAAPGATGDALFDADYLYQLYQRADPQFTGRVTVPVLWDTKTDQIVNNESSEIIRMLNHAFDDLGAASGDYYPEALRDEIDAVNAKVYGAVNNGVYKTGFASTQEAYEEALHPLFETLDWLEQRLDSRDYLVGDQLTEADVRLFTTLIRFDAVYVVHFKCNIRRIADYPNLWRFTRNMYQDERIRPTVNFEHIKKHYFVSHTKINPFGIVPAGPAIDYDQPAT